MKCANCGIKKPCIALQSQYDNALLCASTTHKYTLYTDFESCWHRVAVHTKVEVDIHDDADDNGCPGCAIAGALMMLRVHSICVYPCATLTAATCVKWQMSLMLACVHTYTSTVICCIVNGHKQISQRAVVASSAALPFICHIYCHLWALKCTLYSLPLNTPSAYQCAATQRCAAAERQHAGDFTCCWCNAAQLLNTHMRARKKTANNYHALETVAASVCVCVARLRLCVRMYEWLLCCTIKCI